MKIHKKLAKSISYGGKRSRSSIKYIVIHYTGNKGDTASDNATYFATSNTRTAGAHFFVDKKGEIWRSIPINRTAWAVGSVYDTSGDAGSYYQKCTNSNSVSIELCDLTTGSPSWQQIRSVYWLVKRLQKQCVNAKTIIRHWDVNGKSCPATMTGKNNKEWRHLHNYLTKGYQIKGTLKEDCITRTGSKTTDEKIGKLKKGRTVYITRISADGKAGRLKKKSKDGRYRWVRMSKVKE